MYVHTYIKPNILYIYIKAQFVCFVYFMLYIYGAIHIHTCNTFTYIKPYTYSVRMYAHSVCASCITNIFDLVLERNSMAVDFFFVPSIFLQRRAPVVEAASVGYMDGSRGKVGGWVA